MSDESKRFAKDLRKLADLYEKHPEIETPYVGDLLVFPTRERLTEIAKELAYLKPKKNFFDEWFGLSVAFDSFNLKFTIEREKVCERVRVGTQIVERPAEPAKPARIEEVPQYEWKCSEAILR